MSTVVFDPALGRAVQAAAHASPTPASDTPRPRPADVDLDDPQLLLEPRAHWLELQPARLHEAQDPGSPILERLKFLAITVANLDEFFMKRIGGLKQQVVAGFRERSVDGRTPEQQIAECFTEIRAQEETQRALAAALLAELADHGIRVVAYERLTAAEQEALREYYMRNVFPLVTPLAMDRRTRSRSSRTCR
jgi:polyphosphate kinase